MPELRSVNGPLIAKSNGGVRSGNKKIPHALPTTTPLHEKLTKTIQAFVTTLEVCCDQMFSQSFLFLLCTLVETCTHDTLVCRYISR